MRFCYIHWAVYLLLATTQQFLDNHRSKFSFLGALTWSSVFLHCLLPSILCFSLSLALPLPFSFLPPIRRLIHLYDVALWGGRATLAGEQGGVSYMAQTRMQKCRPRTRSKYRLVACPHHPTQLATPHLRTKCSNMSLWETFRIPTITPNSPY